jgi:predicted CXXCH cytochrome family protein
VRGRVPGFLAGGGLAVVAALWIVAAPVAADAGPHLAGESSGATTLTADNCAGCHRAHTAKGQMLIAASTESELCFLCHGSTGAGATTTVVDGVLAGTAYGLRGGGFTNALMDTSWTGAAVSRPVTSAHTYDGTSSVTMWGNGAIGSGAGPKVTLSCSGCHNPHGNNSYRILRPIPKGSGAAVGVTVPEQTTRVYSVASAQSRYFGESYAPTYWSDYWAACCTTSGGCTPSTSGARHVTPGMTSTGRRWLLARTPETPSTGTAT